MESTHSSGIMVYGRQCPADQERNKRDAIDVMRVSGVPSRSLSVGQLADRNIHYQKGRPIRSTGMQVSKTNETKRQS